MCRNHGLTIVIGEGVRGGSDGVRRVAVACGSGVRRWQVGWRRHGVMAYDKGGVGGMWLFSVMSDGTLRGDEKICPDINLQNVGGTFCKFVFL